MPPIHYQKKDQVYKITRLFNMMKYIVKMYSKIECCMIEILFNTKITKLNIRKNVWIIINFSNFKYYR